MRIRFQVTYQAPVERVFPFLADPATWPRWSPPAFERRRIDDGPVRPGARWASADHVGPMTVRFEDVPEEIEANRHVAWRHTSPWNGRTALTCEPHGSGTLVSADFAAEPTGRLRLLRLMPDRIAARVWRSDFERLATLLEPDVPNRRPQARAEPDRRQP